MLMFKRKKKSPTNSIIGGPYFSAGFADDPSSLWCRLLFFLLLLFLQIDPFNEKSTKLKGVYQKPIK